MTITGYGDEREYLSIITRMCGHGRTSLPISHVCVSGEVDPSTIFGIKEKTAKENQYDLFKNYEKKLVAIFLSLGEDVKVQNNAAQRTQRKEEAYHLIELGIPRYVKSHLMNVLMEAPLRV